MAGVLGTLAISHGAIAKPVKASGGAAVDRVSGQDLWVEPPTLKSIGLEWRIKGDANRNASVAVDYRKAGSDAWRKALPLVRLQGEKIGNLIPPKADFHPDPNNYTSPNMFAGSVLDLEPDTAYQVRLTLSDPEGVDGARIQTVNVRTRPEPMPAAGGKVYHVYPIGWTGEKQEPAFTGLMEAYYHGAASSDFQGTYPARVQPGDTILVHAGVYQSDRVRYLNGLPHPGYNALSTLFDGTYYLTASGTAEKPIVIKGAGDGEVIFDGNGAQTFFNLMAANYNYFEGITFRNANLVFLLGYKNIAGASGFTLKHSRLYDIGRGVQAEWSGSKDFYIADNSIVGRHDPAKMMGWRGKDWSNLPGFPEKLGGPEGSEYGVKLYGQGHVVAHNYVANWHDAIDVATYGDPDVDDKGLEKRDRVPVSIDFYGNDIFNMGDNCIEADGGAHNIRVFDNRCFNSISGALSATPLIGGPVYFFRNLVYNTTSEGVMKVRTAANVLLYQNTFVGEVEMNAPNQFIANNLILGASATTPLMRVSSYTNYSNSDHNAFGVNASAPHAFEWNTPPFEIGMDWVTPLTARRFKTLDALRAATGQERHSVAASYADLVHVSAPVGADIQHLYLPEDYDFRPAANSSLVDAGVVLPTINDGFVGKAPDIGAFELGAQVRSYGPRRPVPGAVGGNATLRSMTGPSQ
ncbi:hypothetical protein FXN63_21915 [Pigmentiphaga aceris]|uniref:Right-handed parallel beta-helix repeat-containing protein n=1 Tax=Pigmentiphaga aceris TaxID=1940612 RepID=A0A5C0B0Q4_9BURK|nr:hypothetical protein [Pigmentiphaga aceris]QEI08198.1 hypothetical protein FXN63_21915 [Pigmentiphaga aceris]